MQSKNAQLVLGFCGVLASWKTTFQPANSAAAQDGGRIAGPLQLPQRADALVEQQQRRPRRMTGV
jgi:hypothetical protein